MRKLICVAFVVCLPTAAEATPITWEFAGTVKGYICLVEPTCQAGNLQTAVPLGTLITATVTFDLDAPDPLLPCMEALTTNTNQRRLPCSESD